MNTRLIENTKVKVLPYFPVLAADRTNRIITKHYTNIVLVLDQDAAALLTWLIYQCDKRNTFIYSTHLVNKYVESIKQARVVYNSSNGLSLAPIKCRYALKSLIENGLVWPVEGKKYMINPALSFNPDYCSRRVWFEYIRNIYEHTLGPTFRMEFWIDKYLNLKP